MPTIAGLATEAEIASAGSLTAYIVLMGLTVFFEFGTTVLGIGAVVLSQDAIIGEKQSGVAEWLLAKPVARRSYVAPISVPDFTGEYGWYRGRYKSRPKKTRLFLLPGTYARRGKRTDV